MLGHGVRSLPPAAPHAPQDGLQLEAGLGRSSQLHDSLRIGLLHGLHYGRELFLKAMCAAGLALTCRGRGTLGRKFRRRSLSQPRCGCTGRPSVAAIQTATWGPVQSPPSGGLVKYPGQGGALGRR
jgi:hypothetical protein